MTKSGVQKGTTWGLLIRRIKYDSGLMIKCSIKNFSPQLSHRKLTVDLLLDFREGLWKTPFHQSTHSLSKVIKSRHRFTDTSE